MTDEALTYKDLATRLPDVYENYQDVQQVAMSYQAAIMISAFEYDVLKHAGGIELARQNFAAAKSAVEQAQTRLYDELYLPLRERRDLPAFVLKSVDDMATTLNTIESCVSKAHAAYDEWPSKLQSLTSGGHFTSKEQLSEEVLAPLRRVNETLIHTVGAICAANAEHMDVPVTQADRDEIRAAFRDIKHLTDTIDDKLSPAFKQTDQRRDLGSTIAYVAMTLKERLDACTEALVDELRTLTRRVLDSIHDDDMTERMLECNNVINSTLACVESATTQSAQLCALLDEAAVWPRPDFNTQDRTLCLQLRTLYTDSRKQLLEP